MHCSELNENLVHLGFDDALLCDVFWNAFDDSSLYSYLISSTWELEEWISMSSVYDCIVVVLSVLVIYISLKWEKLNLE